MKLTGKSLTDFEHFLYTKYNDCQIKPEEEIYWQHISNELTLFDIYEKLPEVLQNALIIEFFDSVGIYILITDFDGDNFWCEFNGLGYSILGKTRQEATEQAIKKANYLYNERKV